MTNFSLKQPYTIIAASLLIAVMGIIAYLKTPIDLFPDSTPPQVAVITVQPGASASNISHKITEVLEKEINSISGLKRIVSSSRDQVSSINAEFEYSKPIGEAVVDVQNAVSRVEAVLPDNILKPAVYRITNTTKPLMTIALSPAQNSSKTLIDIRLLAENQIMKSLLQVEGVADVDFFGANQPEIQISVKKAELDANDLSIAEVIGILRQYNINFPSGNVYSSKNEFDIFSCN
jgi:multidrug efflux pump subunit AcrB